MQSSTSFSFIDERLTDTHSTPSEPGSSSGLPWDPLEAAGVGLAIDVATAQAVRALRDAGVRSIVLKGASFDAWLFDPDEPRFYGDLDLLVAGDAFDQAAGVLKELGFRQRAQREPARVVEHAQVWVRRSDMMVVDLHRTLAGADGGDGDPWEVLAAGTERMTIAGTEVEILSEPARALHVALHAATSPAGAEKPLLDLTRALDRVGVETWRAAASLADRLGAGTAFAAGLRMHPAGEALCAELGLATMVEANLLADSAPYASWTLSRIMATPGLLGKLRIVAVRLFPAPAFMRVWYPTARRGGVWLLLAYVRRIVWLAAETPRAIRALRRARRQATASARDVA